MFAEDVDLLPDKLFKRMLEASETDPEQLRRQRAKAVRRHGEAERQDRLPAVSNGSTAACSTTTTRCRCNRDDIKLALKAANQDWSNIDPSIMGTLFERGLDPDKRSQLGAHYTDPDKIMMIVDPVIVEPLTREWDGAKAEIVAELGQARQGQVGRREDAGVQSRNVAEGRRSWSA